MQFAFDKKKAGIAGAVGSFIVAAVLGVFYMGSQVPQPVPPPEPPVPTPPAPPKPPKPNIRPGEIDIDFLWFLQNSKQKYNVKSPLPRKN